MQAEENEKALARRSAWLYLPISGGAATGFAALALQQGSYSPVAIAGGAFWVGLLTLIVSMPLSTAYIKRRAREWSVPHTSLEGAPTRGTKQTRIH